MKLSKEELYRLHHFFLPLDEIFFSFFCLGSSLVLFRGKRIFFFSVVREKGRKKVFASRSAHSLFRPPSIPPPPLVLLPTPCESSFRSIEEDEIIGCARRRTRVGVELFCCCCCCLSSNAADPGRRTLHFCCWSVSVARISEISSCSCDDNGL